MLSSPMHYGKHGEGAGRLHVSAKQVESRKQKGENRQCCQAVTTQPEVHPSFHMVQLSYGTATLTKWVE